MIVNIALVSAALEGDLVARAQLNDLLEEYQLPKMPEIKFSWKENNRVLYCKTASMMRINVYQRYNHQTNKFIDKWSIEIDSGYENIPYDTKEEAMRAAEKLFLKKLYE
jgi:hypothetical protein